jgi:hypothetical protein
MKANQLRIELLKIVGSKLETKRNALIDKINILLNSQEPNRINMIYKTELKLVQIESALELNNYFIVQAQQDMLTDLVADDMIKGTMDAVGKHMEEDKGIGDK